MILLTGAGGVVGFPLQRQLVVQEIAHKSVSRGPKADIQWDMRQAPSTQIIDLLVGSDTLIHCAPVWLLPAHLEVLHVAGISRLVVFSSTSVISKVSSGDSSEQRLVAQLSDAEAALQRYCEDQSLALTVLRPSMIYGYGRDQNIMQIAGFIRRFGFMPLAAESSGLRQPVHADDLAEAALKVLLSQITIGRAYQLCGAETLSYRQMVERIFIALGKKPRILPIPLALLRFSLRLAARLSGFSYTAEMANRMSQDLNYDYSTAVDDFGFQPQAFLQQPSRDLIQ